MADPFNPVQALPKSAEFLRELRAQFGNLGRNLVIGPDQRRVDVSVSKRTRLTERTSLEFRTEAYNISNTPSFRNPERNIVNASFGQITRTRGGPRVIQFALKLRF